MHAYEYQLRQVQEAQRAGSHQCSSSFMNEEEIFIYLFIHSYIHNATVLIEI